MTQATPEILVVGVGSSHGDDRAGWLVVEQLAMVISAPPVALRQAGKPIDLIDWLPAAALVVCDACRAGGRPASVRRWRWPADRDALAAACWTGTHDWPLPATLELADRLSALPPHVTVWGIEIAQTGGEGASAAVRRAARVVAEQIVDELLGLLDRSHMELKRCTNDR